MKIRIWDIENRHIILSEDEIWVILFFLWQLINLLIMKKKKKKEVYIYILVGTCDLRTLWNPPEVSWGGGAKKDKIIKYIWLVLSV
jgi:hypothetical protein